MSRAVAAVVAIAVAFTAASTPVGAQNLTPPASDSAPAGRSRALPPWRVDVRLDNDAFNFWESITDRPDQEYTNGDEVTVEFSAAPWWGKRFAKRWAPCTGMQAPGTKCRTTSLSIAQDMYTPRPHHEPRTVPDWTNERPYAAILYSRAEARVASERSLQMFSLLLGVTGPPAFGELAQKTAHKLTGVYSRQPVGWDTQIGFEPAVMLGARNKWRFAGRTSSGSAVIDFLPQIGASVGNLLTEAESGFETRLGVHLSNPWWSSEWSTRRPFELYLLGGARGEAVAHNITLDGNTLGADRKVDRVPLVGEYTVGIGARIHGFVAEWRAVTRTREYRTGPIAHTYSQILASYEVPSRASR
jgi:hypothetical protein